MKSFAVLLLSFAAAAVAPCKAAASDLLGPIWHLKGKHVGYAETLSWSIEYTGQWGRTVVSAGGAVFHHDLCCGGAVTADPSWIYPEQYWGEYPMYYLGTDMHYRITVSNTHSDRTYRHLRLVAIQEYLSPEGEWGEWMGEDAAKDWYIPELGPGQTAVYDGSYHIAPGGRPGLNQTHIQLQHWNGGAGTPGPGSVLIDDVQAALWCPPETAGEGDIMQRPTAPEGPASAAVEIYGGPRGHVSARRPLTVAYRVPRAGQVRVAILNRRGSIVWEQIGFSGAGTLGTMTWDGNDISGSPVSPGVYMVLVQGPGVAAKRKVAVVR